MKESINRVDNIKIIISVHQRLVRKWKGKSYSNEDICNIGDQDKTSTQDI